MRVQQRHKGISEKTYWNSIVYTLVGGMQLGAAVCSSHYSTRSTYWSQFISLLNAVVGGSCAVWLARVVGNVLFRKNFNYLFIDCKTYL